MSTRIPGSLFSLLFICRPQKGRRRGVILLENILCRMHSYIPSPSLSLPLHNTRSFCARERDASSILIHPLHRLFDFAVSSSLFNVFVKKKKCQLLLPPAVLLSPPSVTVGSSLWKKVEKRVPLFTAERGTAARLRMQYFRMEMP
ncbi:hypothetical protein CDAR_40411 [Caerostris darwini]|uniref:Secreted protein n=1 Tax=Caerostris darwini TaxID=1538125 RepID=A0AAV4R920_9ARAC|nr:hypothetical protein CDAR_40411 [Caerostris darwini]